MRFEKNGEDYVSFDKEKKKFGHFHNAWIDNTKTLVLKQPKKLGDDKGLRDIACDVLI